MTSVPLRYCRWTRARAIWCARHTAVESGPGRSSRTLTNDRSHAAAKASSAADADAIKARVRAEPTEIKAKIVARVWGAVMANLLSFQWVAVSIWDVRSRNAVRISTRLNRRADASQNGCFMFVTAEVLDIAAAA